MFRSLAFISLSASSLFWFGCSNNDTPIKTPVVLGDDMADGTGGNGGGGGTGGGADMAMPASTDMGPALPDLAGLPAADHPPTQHPPLPTMTAFSGASTIKAPEIWTVVWKGDEALGDKVNAFNTWMLASDYWKTGMAGFGVGAGVAKGKIVVNSPPPATITDAQLSALIDSNIGKTGWPPSKTANTIISFALDLNTVVTQGGQPASCVQFDGYHSISPSKNVPYLVNAYCKNAAGMPDWNNLTVTMSHEAGEASSDWDLNHNRVVDSVTGAPYLGGGENGDLCLSLNSPIVADATNTYMVQRLWSNSVAVANNGDPCLPTDGIPWFGAGLYGGGTDQSVINVTLDASGKGSAQFKIEPFSFDPNFGPVGFYVAGSLLPAGVTLTPDIAVRTVNGMRVGSVAYGNPGSTTNLTVNVDSTFQSNGQPITFLIIARDVAKTHYNIWWGTLMVQ